ncbi:transmembrane protein 117 isoform X1 [Syngnathus scovelli]|uniref:transmembrane protein 117 isoform X1 n=2 Tax=Syngnathus scovelli TaxID=161590 RepID=UPI0021109887|nr:transmembrane protein 117 isoform X1 [Syngnathus scovelli]
MWLPGRARSGVGKVWRGWRRGLWLSRMEPASRLRYYFRHPWSRIVVAYMVIFFNFLIFAEDPVSHSQKEARIAVVGNCFSFLFSKYPGAGWSVLKVVCWMLAIFTGLLAGKFFFHQQLFGRYLRLKAFREDHGSWMTMFFTTILSIFIFSHIYNLFLLMAGSMESHMVTDHMGIKNTSFMKMAAVGTWMGDFGTAWMVTDMMLQDNNYPHWGKGARRFWKQGNNRIVLFWTVLNLLTTLVVSAIATDWLCWDCLNRGFLPSDEVSRAFLASFILVFDLLIVMQDWEFPHFMGNMDIKLPGLPTAQLNFKLPVCKYIFKEEYRIHITGKWFNYGIIFLVLILDLNMWKNQIFYQPYEYGQYVGPGEYIFNVEKAESLRTLNRSTLTYEWRTNNVDPSTNRSYKEHDLWLHSRYIGASMALKCLAFLPSLLTFISFGGFILMLGRFSDSETENRDNSYERMNRKSSCGKQTAVTPEEGQDVNESDGLKRSGTSVPLLTEAEDAAVPPPASDTVEEAHPSAAGDLEASEESNISHEIAFLRWLGIERDAEETGVSQDVAHDPL